jgi:hypothetical protein
LTIRKNDEQISRETIHRETPFNCLSDLPKPDKPGAHARPGAGVGVLSEIESIVYKEATSIIENTWIFSEFKEISRRPMNYQMSKSALRNFLGEDAGILQIWIAQSMDTDVKQTRPL